MTKLFLKLVMIMAIATTPAIAGAFKNTDANWEAVTQQVKQALAALKK